MPPRSASSKQPRLDRRRAKRSWREILAQHPACELFPSLSEDELREIGEDIRRKGRLTSPIVLLQVREPQIINGLQYNSLDDLALLDGRNRLDAMELVGIAFEIKYSAHGWHIVSDVGKWKDGRWPDSVQVEGGTIDPYSWVISSNLHRRHLTPEQKRAVIGKLLKMTPEKSDRQIAKVAKADHKTVGAERKILAARGEIPHVAKRTDTKGRKQPGTRKTPKRTGDNFTADMADNLLEGIDKETRGGMAAHKELKQANVQIKGDLEQLVELLVKISHVVDDKSESAERKIETIRRILGGTINSFGFDMATRFGA